MGTKSETRLDANIDVEPAAEEKTESAASSVDANAPVTKERGDAPADAGADVSASVEAAKAETPEGVEAESGAEKQDATSESPEAKDAKAETPEGSEAEKADDASEGGKQGTGKAKKAGTKKDGAKKEKDAVKAAKPKSGKKKKTKKDAEKAAAKPIEEPEEEEEEGWGLNLFTIFVLLAASAITVIYFMCTVRTVHVSGNSLYTSQEIAERVISDDSQLRHNTVFLALLYATPWAPKIPFEESVRVSIEDYDTIRITVKDMDIAGYIPYGGKNLYFSSDGIVLEHSPLTIKNAAFVTGLSITNGEIGTKMEADNPAGLGQILEALEVLGKYDLHAESLFRQSM